MIEPNVRKFLDAQPVGVLGTSRPDGSMRQSLVYHARVGDTIVISTESKRAKARDVERTGTASYCVFAHDKPFASVTVEGKARIVREGAGALTGRIAEVISGQAPDPMPTDEQMAAVDRVIIELTVERAYGRSHF